MSVMRRYCPTRKLKHFNEAWALIAAQEQSEAFGSSFRVYRCSCGWWHTYNRKKARSKDDQRESRRDRRKRSKRGESPPFQALAEERKGQERKLKDRRRKIRKELPLRVWEDDGGACVRPPSCPEA